MSFQDFRSSSSNKRKTASAPQSAPSSIGISASGSRNGLTQISDILSQYQRNVGILEKIVQSLTDRNNNARAFNADELNMQYRAQVDVIGQLEEKVRRQLEQQKNACDSPQKTTLIKLQRDFQRVQGRATALQSNVTRMRKQQEAALKSRAAVAQDPTAAAANDAGGDYYQQMQLQLQQDRMNEEVMREREEEIRKINRGMHQVNEIYKDLAHIVGSQQEQIDTIETQMEDSRANAESGLQQVEKANDNFGNSQCTIS